MFLKRLFTRMIDPVDTLYGEIVAAARQPLFYREMAVPDTVDGRFDMIILHLFLVLGRLRGQGRAAEDTSQRLTDAFFKDMDRSLREMGVGDLSVGKKVRKMAEACYGRLRAYDVAVASGRKDLVAALGRNIYAGAAAGKADDLAGWAMDAQAFLATQPVEDMISGRVRFP